MHTLDKVPLYKKVLSYFYPLKIADVNSDLNQVLALYLYRNEWQLATEDALYSDGSRYQPIRKAYEDLSAKLPRIKKVLVLGTGIGSAVQIMRKMGFSPEFTLVDNDKVILDLAINILSNDAQINPILMDAAVFVKDSTEKFDLLIIDIFESRVVPAFVTTAVFLDSCKNHLNTGGSLIFNYITHWPEKYDRLKEIMNSVFPSHKVLHLNTNKVFIATV